MLGRLLTINTSFCYWCNGVPQSIYIYIFVSWLSAVNCVFGEWGLGVVCVCVFVFLVPGGCFRSRHVKIVSCLSCVFVFVLPSRVFRLLSAACALVGKVLYACEPSGLPLLQYMLLIGRFDWKSFLCQAVVTALFYSDSLPKVEDNLQKTEHTWNSYIMLGVYGTVYTNTKKKQKKRSPQNRLKRLHLSTTTQRF